jgi:hypothetical protein
MLFNSKGELNASSFQDALETISKYASVIQNGLPSNYALSGAVGLSEEHQDELVARALNTHEGKLALAQAMANPIRQNLDYQGIARRALVPDVLTQGALPVYHRDIDVTAVVVSAQGSGPESRVFSEAITVPTFELFSNPTIRTSEVRRKRFNIIDRAVQKARQEIMAQEDANVFAAIDVAASVENTLQDIADSGLLKRDLVNLKRQVDRWDLITSKFFMNINEYTDTLLWSSSGPSNGEIDPVLQREILQTGIVAKLWGADIMVSKIVPAGTVYACADPEFVGMMPIRSDIEVMPADEPKRLSLGWVVSEEIGICIAVTRGVSAGRKSVLPGV